MKYFAIKEPDGNLLLDHRGENEAEAVSSFITFQKMCVQASLQLKLVSPNDKLAHQTWEHYQADGYDVVEIEVKEIPSNPNICDGCGAVWYNCLCSHDD